MKITIQGKNAFPKKYIKAADLRERDVTLTISSVRVEALRDPKTNEEEDAYIVRFQEFASREGGKAPHLFVLNKTNAESIAAATGEGEMMNWPGKRVTLYPTRVKAFGEKVDAIRVRDNPPPQNGAGTDLEQFGEPDFAPGDANEDYVPDEAPL